MDLTYIRYDKRYGDGRSISYNHDHDRADMGCSDPIENGLVHDDLGSVVSSDNHPTQAC